MDNITHTLAGLLLSRAGCNRLTPRANWILILAANAPDVDVVSSFGGSLTFLHYHRNVTHALIALPILPVFCVLLVSLAFRRRLPWMGAYVAAMIGVASHLALDLTNIYGVRLLEPFSGRWFRWDLTGVIDFWIWGVLLITTLAPMLGRLVNSEIGAATRSGAYRGFAVAGLAFLVLYNGTRYILHNRAIAILESREYAGASARRVAAFPTMSLIRWRGLAETADSFVTEEIDLTREFDPSAGRTFYKPEASPAIDAANRSDVFQEYLRFAQYPFWQVLPAEQAENATRVEAMDLRFGDPQSPGFIATAIVDAHLRILRAWFQFGRAAPR